MISHYPIENSIQHPPQTFGGSEIAKLSTSTKAFMAKQVVDLLKLHVEAGHMVKQTIPGLIEYMDSGLTVVTVTPELEVFGFVKLYPYVSSKNTPPLGYEFSSWVSKKKGVGLEVLKKSLGVFNEQENPHADFFAVCSSDNDTPQRILFMAGGTDMERPSYVPNMLAAQTGEMEHPETIINLKTIPG